MNSIRHFFNPCDLYAPNMNENEGKTPLSNSIAVNKTKLVAASVFGGIVGAVLGVGIGLVVTGLTGGLGFKAIIIGGAAGFVAGSSASVLALKTYADYINKKCREYIKPDEDCFGNFGTNDVSDDEN